VSFLVKRPCTIIGSDLKIEFLNFVINKDRKRKRKKRVLPECNVEMLAHINDKSTLLLEKLSGTVNTYKDNKKSITFLGCGSLGSKIALHLARNGNDNFLCVDNDCFLPHNNARHALLFSDYFPKASSLSLAIKGIGNAIAIPENKSAFEVDYPTSKIIIDTTASLSVRNFLLKNKKLPPIISAGLYNSGKFGLLLIERGDKSCKLLHEWAFLYQRAFTNKDLRHVLFNDKLENINIGQSCRDQTMVASDAQISLMASAMSIKIQEIISNNFDTEAEIDLYSYQDRGLSIEKINIPSFLELPSSNGWDLYISSEISDLMLKYLISKRPNETGGVLMGTVFDYAKTAVITLLLPVPSDSIEKRNMFVLGTHDLYKEIQKTESKTSGKVTCLGTWHTHPCGESVSLMDKETFEKLLKDRNYEPTVCLIRTPSEIILV
jgi:hypothetical protein